LAAGIFPCRPHTPYYAVNRVKLNHKYAIQIARLLKTADSSPDDVQITPNLQMETPRNQPLPDMPKYYHNSFAIMTAFTSLRALAKYIHGIECVVSKELNYE